MKKILSLFFVVFLFSTSCSKGRAASDDDVDIEDEKYFVEYKGSPQSNYELPEEAIYI